MPAGVIHSYQDLVVWQKAMALVTAVSSVTRQFPSEEMFGLTSQMRRAGVSIPSHSAEGHDRVSSGAFRQFLGNARGALTEIETQILIAPKSSYLPETEVVRLLAIVEVGRVLNSLISALKESRQRSGTRRQQ